MLSKVGTKPSAERIWQRSLKLGESHHLIIEVYLRSISFSEVQLYQADLDNALLPEDPREMEQAQTAEGTLRFPVIQRNLLGRAFS